MRSHCSWDVLARWTGSHNVPFVPSVGRKNASPRNSSRGTALTASAQRGGVEVGAHALDHGGRRLNDRPTEVHPQRGTRLRLYPPPHPRTLPRRELESCFVAITDEDPGDGEVRMAQAVVWWPQET